MSRRCLHPRFKSWWLAPLVPSPSWWSWPVIECRHLTFAFAPGAFAPLRSLSLALWAVFTLALSWRWAILASSFRRTSGRVVAVSSACLALYFELLLSCRVGRRAQSFWVAQPEAVIAGHWASILAFLALAFAERIEMPLPLLRLWAAGLTSSWVRITSPRVVHRGWWRL